MQSWLFLREKEAWNLKKKKKKKKKERKKGRKKKERENRWEVSLVLGGPLALTRSSAPPQGEQSAGLAELSLSTEQQGYGSDVSKVGLASSRDFKKELRWVPHSGLLCGGAQGSS